MRVINRGPIRIPWLVNRYIFHLRPDCIAIMVGENIRGYIPEHVVGTYAIHSSPSRKAHSWLFINELPAAPEFCIIIRTAGIRRWVVWRNSVKLVVFFGR